jgi:large subunit ribosomal protein L15
MKIHHLKPAEGAHRKKTRKGRGEAAGKGKTAGRGTKGTGARGTVPAGFEGGQMPLQRRLPKLPGFTPRNRVEYATVNVAKLDAAFSDGDTVTPSALREKGLIRRGSAPVKVLGNGELSKNLTVQAHAFSASAAEKIAAGGGSTEVLSRRATPSA